MSGPSAEALWRERVARVLKGAPFESLVSHTLDGIAVQPLYAKGEAPGHSMRQRPDRPWRIVQRLDHPDPVIANELALADLQGGADALALVFAGSPASRGFGLRACDLAGALAGVELDLIALRLELPARGGTRAVEAVAELVARQRLVPETLAIDFGLDPLAALTVAGRPYAEGTAEAMAIVRRLTQAGFAGSMLRADGRAHHDAGASEAQELAAVLASGVAYLRLLEAAGIAPDAARRLLSFQLSADADQFLGIAKFRAIRRLWAQVERACALQPEPIHLAGETSLRMMSRRDPAVNWLRTISALFAAATGGADAISVLPHTAALGLPDAFSRRMARNEQIILIEESHLARVGDPGAGSGAIEALTDELCRAVWALLRRIEAAGGLAAMLASGEWQAAIAETADARSKGIADGETPLVGVTAFRNETELPSTVLMPVDEIARDAAALPVRRDAALHENGAPT